MATRLSRGSSAGGLSASAARASGLDRGAVEGDRVVELAREGEIGRVARARRDPERLEGVPEGLAGAVALARESEGLAADRRARWPGLVRPGSSPAPRERAASHLRLPGSVAQPDRTAKKAPATMRKARPRQPGRGRHRGQVDPTADRVVKRNRPGSYSALTWNFSERRSLLMSLRPRNPRRTASRRRGPRPPRRRTRARS